MESGSLTSRVDICMRLTTLDDSFCTSSPCLIVLLSAYTWRRKQCKPLGTKSDKANAQITSLRLQTYACNSSSLLTHSFNHPENICWEPNLGQRPGTGCWGYRGKTDTVPFPRELAVWLGRKTVIKWKTTQIRENYELWLGSLRQ